MAKIPLLLLPGLLSDKTVWQHQCDHLSDIADIMIPNLNTASTPHEMVEAVLKDAPPSFVLVGHSMGGWVALETMRNASNRVLALGLINTTAFPDSQEKHAARLAMIAHAEHNEYKPIIERLTQLFVYNKAVVPAIKEMFEKNLLAFVNQEKAMLQREDCIRLLDSINCKTLVLHAENDAVFHLEDSELLVSKIKHATLSIIKKSGHMSPMEAPEEVTQLLRSWLMV